MKALLTIATVVFALTATIAQPGKTSVVIGSMTTKPNALLIVNPENSDQGVLFPQLSTRQRMSIKPSSPDEDGLIVFDSTKKSYYYWSDGQWISLESEHETSFVSIDPADFQEMKSDKELTHNNLVIFDNDNTFVTVSRDGRGEAIIAPVDLPHGAAMKELKIYYMDNDQNNLNVYLVRKNWKGRNEELLRWESAGANASIRTETFSNFAGAGEVDREHYTYRVIVTFDLDFDETVEVPWQAKQRLYGISIKYQK